MGRPVVLSREPQEVLRTQALTGLAVQQRAQALRQRIRATVVRRAPQVIVKVTGGGRGMGAIAAHLRYIAKGGRLPFEDDRGVVREGREALHAVVDQWRLGGSRIPEKSERREAFNLMLSMPRGTDERVLVQAVREFAKAELANHRYVMVLHSHQANPQVHLSVRAEGRDGQRLNPHKEDLRRWREVFAQRLRPRGIEAEATPQCTRGARHLNERVWERKSMRWPLQAAGPQPMRMQMSPSLSRAGEAWVRIAQALATSTQAADRELGQAVLRYVRKMPVVKTLLDRSSAQREFPGISRTIVTPTRSDPEIER
jgi:hypothetical protein